MFSELSLNTLVGALLVLIVASAYFSSSETAMMALNRYRLKHLADREHRAARRAQKLLERPDRLIGLILFGNNLVNILAAQITTVVALRLYGEGSIFVAGLALTAIVLIFAEVVPKTMAALHPERIAFPSSLILRGLLFILFPFVWVLNGISNRILSLVGVESVARSSDPLNREELRTVVKEAGAMISVKHRQMLFGILDLESATVEDIMVPRGEIYAIDLERGWNEIVDQLVTCRHTRVPCYTGHLDAAVGVLHLRKVARLLRADDEFSIDDLRAILDEPYYVPLKTDLYVQLLNFQKHKQRIGLVVDEYGDIEGLVTLEDLLEEVIGRIHHRPASLHPRCLSAGRRQLSGRRLGQHSRSESGLRLGSADRRSEDPEWSDPRDAREHSGKRHHFPRRRLHHRDRADPRPCREDRAGHARAGHHKRAARRSAPAGGNQRQR